MMEPVVEPFAATVAKVPRNAPEKRWISSLTGAPITDEEAVDPRYWARQLREPVQFAKGVGALVDAHLALVEMGPGQALATLARQNDKRIATQLITTSLHPGQDFAADLDHLLVAAGQLWARNVAIDWRKFHGDARRRRIALPTYPFRRVRHWVDPMPQADAAFVSTSFATPAATMPVAPNPLPTLDPAAMTSQRSAALLARLQALFADLSGVDAGSLTPDANFLELGFDSLFLTQASNALQKQFATKITVRTLLEDAPTLNQLVERILPTLPEDALPVAAAAAPLAAPSFAMPAMTMPADASGLAGVFAQQLAIISRQLEMLGLRPGQPMPATPAATNAPANPSKPAAPKPSTTTTAAQPTSAFGPYRPPNRSPTGGLTEEQQKHLAAIIARYNAKTAKSKAATEANRLHLADPRSVSGFRQSWKEMVYPIVTTGSSGSHLTDVDGNDYIDITNGFGMIFFGHNPKFIREAVDAQYDKGIEIGPQTPLAGEVAKLVCEMVGMERAAFCSTGSEAVMAAIRMARTVSGRDKVVMFTGAYHGIFDEVLVRPTKSGDGRAMPIAPGVPLASTENMLVLEYGTQETLDTIRSLKGELAAVLVETVQSRRPEFQPREFLHELRRITAEDDVALVFDEVVTGFRIHPGGAQALFGVRADIATYGKVIGGGLPIGMVAGSAKYLDALDGGQWRFGDDSGPEAGVTFFAGTFVRHPLALAAARAVLQKLKQEGPELQRGLNLRNTAFVERLKKVVAELGAPVQVNHFSSWFVVSFPHDLPLAPVYFTLMREKGIHTWEGRPCFLTLAHTDADLDRVVAAFRETLAEMQAADFLPKRTDAPRKGRDAQGRDAWFVPDPDRPGKFLQVEDAHV